MIADHKSGQDDKQFDRHRVTITRYVFRPQRFVQTRSHCYPGIQTVEFQIARDRRAPRLLRYLPNTGRI